MSQTAILIDGGFYRKRAAKLWGKKTSSERAKELIAYCHAHLRNKDGSESRKLYRIFYYDCEPLEKRSVFHPFLKTNIDRDKSETYTWTINFFSELKKLRKVALRFGTLTSQCHYNLQPETTKKWDEGTKNGPDRSALLGHNFVYQETKPHGFYSSYFHQRISS